MSISAEGVMELFGRAGAVAMVRIRKPGQPEPLLAKTPFKGAASLGLKTYAVVEFATPEGAAAAVALLDDSDSWRGGLRVRSLAPPPAGPAQRGGGGGKGGRAQGRGGGGAAAAAEGAAAAEAPAPAAASSAGVGAVEEGVAGLALGAGGEAAPQGAPPQEVAPWDKPRTRTKGGYATWASASAARQQAQQGEGPAPGGGAAAAAAAAAAARQPRMPDGGKGFGAGRGKLLAPPPGPAAMETAGGV
jgi:hypothetical protein